MWSLDLSCGEEETTAALLQNGANKELYEINTIAKFPVQGSCSNLIVKSTNCLTALAIGNQIGLFHDDFLEVVLSLVHESEVECLELADDSTLLLTGEHNGFLSIYHIESQKRLAKMQLVKPVDGKQSFYDILCHSTTSDDFVVNVLVTGSLLYKFHNITTGALKHAALVNDWAEVQNILSKRVVKSLDLNKELEFSVPKGLYYNHDQSILNCFGSGEYVLGLNIQDSIGDLICLDTSFEFKKVRHSSDGLYLMALDSKGDFYIFDGVTYVLIVRSMGQSLKDFSILENTDGNNNFVIQRKLVFLLDVPGSNENELVLKEFPSLSESYRVKVTKCSKLFDPVLNQEYFTFVEAVCSKSSNAENTVKIRILSEALPEMRLEKLLQKRQYDQAEKFAIDFNLDLQGVYKPHVLTLASSECSIEIIQKIKQLLFSIKDAKFLLNFSFNIRLPSASLTKEIYNICIEALESLDDDNNFCFQKQLLNGHDKLNTFTLLYPDPESWNFWFRFANENLQDIFIILLNSAETDKAFCFWNRHFKQILASVEEDFISKILSAIPENVKSADIISWLKESFLRPIQIKFPHLMSLISNWIIERSKLFELTEKLNWPANSIALLSAFPEICSETTELNPHAMINAKYMEDELGNKGYFYKLHTLQENLKQLETLRTHYRCLISLAQFCQDKFSLETEVLYFVMKQFSECLYDGSQESSLLFLVYCSKESKLQVAFIILDLLVKTNRLQDGINNFLRAFIKRHNMNDCQVFYEYILDVLRNQNVAWWYWTEAPWENGALKVIKFITDPDLKFKAAILIVSQAPVPWSPGIKEFANNQVDERPQLKSDMEDKVRLSKVKEILIKYNLRKFKYTSASKAQSLMRFILKHKNYDALPDALQVVDAYDNLQRSECFLHHAILLIERKESEKVFDFFYDLAQTDALECGPRIINYCQLSLEIPTLDMEQDNIDRLRILSKVGFKIASRLLQLRPHDIEFQILQSQLKQVYNLQNEFNIYNERNLVIVNQDKWKLHSYVSDNLSSSLQPKERKLHGNSTGDSEKTSGFTCQMMRLGDILSLSEARVTGEIISKLIQKHYTEEATELCQNLLQKASSTIVILDVLKKLLTDDELLYSENSVNIIEEIHTISCQTLINCSDDTMLLNCIHLCQWTSMLQNLYSTDSHYAFLKKEAPLKLDKYSVWKFSKMYRDQGMGINIKEILPSFLQCLRVTCFTPQDINLRMLLQLFQLSRIIILHLRSKAREEMAMHLLIFLHISFINLALEYEANPSSEAEVQVLKDANSELKRALKDTCFSLMLRIISKNNCDFLLGFTLLVSLSFEDSAIIVKELVRRLLKDHNRMKMLCTISLCYGSHIGKSSFESKIQTLYNLSCWGEELNNLKISCQNIQTLNDNAVAMEILNDLIRSPAVEFKQIVRFCDDFKVEKDKVFLKYLEILLRGNVIEQWGLNSQPAEAEIKALEAVLRNCGLVIDLMVDKESLIAFISGILCEVNCYCFKVFIYLFEKVIEITYNMNLTMTETYPKFVKVLTFLEIYERICPPKNLEIYKWQADHDLELPKIAYVRLPFSIFLNPDEDMKTIITFELMPHTLKDWIYVSSMFKIGKDSLKLKALRNALEKWKEEQPVEEVLRHQPADEAFLQSILDVFEDFPNQELFFTTVVWIIKKIPLGKTKRRLAEYAVEIGQSLTEKGLNRKLQEFITNSQSLYQRISLELILRKFDLYNPRYLDLSHKPKDLIIAVLEDKLNHSVYEMQENNALNAITEVARVSQLDLNEIYISLLDRWLDSGNRDLLFDDTFTCNLNNFAFDLQSQGQEIWTDNLKRTINLLKSLSEVDDILEQLQTTLYSANVGTIQRVQALLCLLVAFDDMVVERLLDQTIPELRAKLSDLIYISQLEELHLIYTIEAFQQFDKLDLVRNVLASSCHDSKALSFSSSLCIRDAIFDERIWNAILQGYISKHMVEELLRLLQELSVEPLFQSQESYIAAWNFVIKVKSEQCQSRAEACSVYSILCRCNCHCALNLLEFSETLFRYGQIPAIATLLLKPENKEKAKALISPKNYKHIKNDFEDLMKNLIPLKRIEYIMVGSLLKEF